MTQVHERGVQAVLAGFDPFDPTNPCHRIPVIASLDTNVKWVWCGDLGCNAALEARYRAYNTAALDAIKAPVRISQAGIARRGSTTNAPSPYELVRAAIAASKPGPTASDGVALSDGHMRVVPSRELQLLDRETMGAARVGISHLDAHGHDASAHGDGPRMLELRAFATVEESIEYVEDELLRWAVHVRKRWQVLDLSFEKVSLSAGRED